LLASTAAWAAKAKAAMRKAMRMRNMAFLQSVEVEDQPGLLSG
jgi:hypothetical protein